MPRHNMLTCHAKARRNSTVQEGDNGDMVFIGGALQMRQLRGLLRLRKGDGAGECVVDIGRDVEMRQASGLMRLGKCDRYSECVVQNAEA